MLYIIISGCFEIGHVPKQWTNSIMNLISEPGMSDNRCPLNNCGNTFISVSCKIYCTIKKKRRLRKWLEESKCLYEKKNGFRRGRSCEEHIFTLYWIINDRKINKNLCLVYMKTGFSNMTDVICYGTNFKGLGYEGNSKTQ